MTDFGRGLIIPKLHEQVVETLHSSVPFDATYTTHTSPSIDVSDYREFTLLIDFGVYATPTNLVIRVQFSHDNVTFYDYMNGPFGSLMYEHSAGDKFEAVHGKVMAKYMRTVSTCSGCSIFNIFILNVNVVLGK